METARRVSSTINGNGCSRGRGATDRDIVVIGGNCGHSPLGLEFATFLRLRSVLLFKTVRCSTTNIDKLQLLDAAALLPYNSVHSAISEPNFVEVKS